MSLSPPEIYCFIPWYGVHIPERGQNVPDSAIIYGEFDIHLLLRFGREHNQSLCHADNRGLFGGSSGLALYRMLCCETFSMPSLLYLL
jgi:hypothetical protein